MDLVEQKALIKAAAAAPHDDLPRLVYADFLEETGEPVHVARAHFIRAQCELARIAPDECDKIAELQHLARNLQADYGDQWEQEYGQQVKHAQLYHSLPQFRCGFQDDLDCTPRSWRRLRQETCKAWPVTSVNVSGDMSQFFRIPRFWESKNSSHLERMEQLERIRINPDDYFQQPQSSHRNQANVRALLDVLAVREAPPLPNLKELSLASLNMGDDTARDLADSEGLKNLKSLNISYNDITDAGFTAIANSPNMAHLQTLLASRCDLHDEALTSLANSQHMTHLNVLKVDNNRHIYNQGVIDLAQSSNADHLMELDLNDTGVGVRGLATIAESSHMANLRALHINFDCSEHRGVVETLVNSPHMAKLETLDWSMSNMGRWAAMALARSEQMSNLKALMLQSGKIMDEGATAIATSPRLRNLERLSLSYNDLTDKGLLAFADCALPNLQYIVLGHNHITRKTEAALHQAAKTPGNALFGMDFDPRYELSGRRTPEKAREAAHLYEQRLAGVPMEAPEPPQTRPSPPHLTRRDRHGTPIPIGGGGFTGVGG